MFWFTIQFEWFLFRCLICAVLFLADLGCYRFCCSWLLLAFGIPLLITLIVLVVSLCNKVYAQEIEDDKAIDHHELIDEENLQLNSATAGRMLCATNDG
ncbi:hypothetical protein LOK49_LG01G03608 [Camellia lanceoleosa]|uniref:Uncharacterized protein n=1 Tax=Camellia lanceoleosa TaxID=1840588 RepID=A0ACC0J6S8_9ERIC|nr:hypothetical protein LOK49_LG01G03608 [Camellia lanceoleosa]